MANELSYTHSMPGGRLSRPFRPHLSRYKSEGEVTPMSDFVTFGDADAIMETLKANALYIGLGLAAVGGLWWWSQKAGE